MFEVKYGTNAVQWYSYKQMKRGLCTVQYGKVLVPYSSVNVHNSTVQYRKNIRTVRYPPCSAPRDDRRIKTEYEYCTRLAARQTCPLYSLQYSNE